MQNLIQFLQSYSEVLFRVMLSLIFIVSGSMHLFATTSVSQKLQNSDTGTWITSFASPELLVLITGFGLVAGGWALFWGFKTQWAALGLLLIIIPITIAVQLQGLNTIGPLFKNVGLMGGLIHFITNGSTNFALDNWMKN